MVYSKKVAFEVAVLVSIASLSLAADTSCIQVTFPNILEFGECLKGPQDLCHGSVNFKKVAMDIFNCAMSGMQHLNFGSQLIVLEGLMKELLTRFGMGKMVDPISSLCDTAGGVVDTASKAGGNVLGGVLKPAMNAVSGVASPLLDCSGINLGGNIMCGSPVVFQFPSFLNIGRCLNNTASICVGNQPNQGQIIDEFFQTVTCVFSSITAKSPAGGPKSMFCSMLNTIQGMMSSGPFSMFAELIAKMENAFGLQC